MDTQDLRTLFEMSYRYAWGNSGSCELRDEWIKLKDKYKESIGNFSYDGDFMWEEV